MRSVPSRPRPRPILACLLATLLAAFLAGCFGGGAKGQSVRPGDIDLEQGAFVTGAIVDPELVPVADAVVTLTPGDLSTTTGADGGFTFGPLAPGAYDLTASKAGYVGGTMAISAQDGMVSEFFLTLEPNDPNVPYRETWTFATFVNCWNGNIVGNVPCTKLPDYVVGTNFSADERFAFSFFVPYDGLVDILTETDWITQPFGRDMVFQVITPPNQALTALIKRYFAASGPPVLQGWLMHGEVNQGGDEPFDGDANEVQYEARIIPSGQNRTVPYFSLYLNHRTDSYITFFYNRAGPRDFTAAPDR